MLVNLIINRLDILHMEFYARYISQILIIQDICETITHELANNRIIHY